MCDINTLKYNTKDTYIKNIPRKNSQETSKIQIKDPHPYKAELIQKGQ